MTKSATPSAKATVVDAAPLPSEERMRLFWEKNRVAIYAIVVIAIVAVIAKGGWEYYQAQQENDIEQDYAKATTPDGLKSFADKHSGHELAGIAKLQIADEAYAAGRSADAVARYDEAMGALKAPELVSRAKLGSAMAKIQAGNPEGEAALKLLAGDQQGNKAVRAEASYHLASLASTRGNTADVRKYVSQVMALDATRQWMQRAIMLTANLPIELPTSALTGDAPAVISGKR